MPRKRRSDTRVAEDHDEVIAWYRAKLAEPAVFPWSGSRWPPELIGPTWQTKGRGSNRRWVLPDASIGWDVLGWCGTRLQHSHGIPWRFTLEQARFLLHWYSVDEAGEWVYIDGVLQRLKGWGKDPVGACLLYVEALGPCRFAGWDGDEPLATDVPDAWVQTAATALEQTKNTMRLMPGLITPEAKRLYRVQVGKEIIHADGDTRLIQAVTSSPMTLEGARSTFVLPNETQHWKRSNDGHEMQAVIERNLTKGGARRLAITNAYEPSEDSVAQRDREAWETAAAGQSLTTGILYDSLEAPPDAPLTAEAAPVVAAAIRGDSVWLNTDRIVQSILDTRNPPSRSRRFWYNQITAAEDAWLVPQDFDACADDRLLLPTEDLVVFFDGSKSDDATGLVGCRLADGHLFTLGMWQRPPGLDREVRWLVPRELVDDRVTEIVNEYRVVALYADPSHALDDVTEERYWDALLDEWHRRWKDRFVVWAQPGKGGHSVMWDMSAPGRTAEFTAAAERFEADVADSARAVADGRPEDRVLTHDGDGRLRRHAHNARRYPNRYGVSLWKGARGSARKIDLAVCAVGARMVRREVLNSSAKKKQRSGRVW